MTVAFVQMDMFLVQLKSHPLIITAHGFFLLDNAMTFTVNSDQFEIDKLQPRFDHQLSFFFQALITLSGYLLILIQFELAKSPNQKQNKGVITGSN